MQSAFYLAHSLPPLNLHNVLLGSSCLFLFQISHCLIHVDLFSLRLIQKHILSVISASASHFSQHKYYVLTKLFLIRFIISYYVLKQFLSNTLKIKRNSNNNKTSTLQHIILDHDSLPLTDKSMIWFLRTGFLKEKDGNLNCFLMSD